MLFKLFLAFTLIPVVEISLILKAGNYLGTVNTVFLIIASGFIGAYLARLQGIRTMLKVRSCLDQGIIPKEELIDALLIFAAGIVLLTPGFVTDITGLLILFPPTREIFKGYMRERFVRWVGEQDIHYTRFH